MLFRHAEARRRASAANRCGFRSFPPTARLLLDGRTRAAIATVEKGNTMKAQMTKYRERLEGKVLVPALMWMAGVPFGIVLLLWFFLFRGR